MTIVARYWHGYVSMLRFELTGQRFLHSILFVVQIVLGGGLALIYAVYLGDDPGIVATGMPAVALVPLGLVSVPVLVNYRRGKGSGEFTWSLPVPRPASVAATMSVFSLAALPGTAAVLGIVALRYDVAFDVGPVVIAAVLLSSLTSASFGFAVAYAAPGPRISSLVNNMLILALLLLTPIVAPLSRLPGWLAAVAQWLPFHHMAKVIRHGLVAGVEGVWRSYLVLLLWTAAASLVAVLVVSRRR